MFHAVNQHVNNIKFKSETSKEQLVHASGRLFLHNNMAYINKQVSKYLYM